MMISTPTLTLTGGIIHRVLVRTLMVVVFVQTFALFSLMLSNNVAAIPLAAAFTFPSIRSNTLMVHKQRHLDLTNNSHRIRNNNHVNTRRLATQIQQDSYRDGDEHVPLAAINVDQNSHDKDMQNNRKTSIMAVKTNMKQMIHLIKAFVLKMKITMSNFFLNENFGKRGETFIVIEFILLYSFLANKVPILQDLFQFLFGPLLFMTGSTLMIFSVHEFHLHQHSLSLYTTPPTMSSSASSASASIPALVTTGIYSYIRHPFYMGTLCAFLGFSFITKSTTRLLMSVFYYILIDRKCQQEDYALLKTYKHLYMNYERQVKNRFLPTRDAISSFLRRFNNVTSSSNNNSSYTFQQGLEKIESNVESQNNTSTFKSTGTLFP